MKEPLIIFCCLLAGVQSVESVIEVTGYVGGSALIRCPYDKGYEGYPKYLCRGSCFKGSKDIPVRTEAGQTKAVNGRFSLHDDTTARVFTVTITGLTSKDSGKYWCAVKTEFGSADVYAEVALKVSQVPPPSPNMTILPSTEDHSLTPPQSSTPPTSNTSPSAPETTISQSAADLQEDTEESVVISVLCVVGVVVVATVCGMALALYYKQKRKKQSAGPTSSTTGRSRDPGQNKEGRSNEAIRMSSLYQNPNATTKQPDSVYQSLNLNTVRPDPVYQGFHPITTKP